jgi:tetratricopeptide (TPR) repeat protein
LLGTLAVALAVLSSSIARADAPTKESKKRARELFNKGVAEYNLGHYAESATAYEEAYRLVQDAALLYNAAQAYRLAGTKDRAVELYLAYLRNYGDQGGKQAEAERFVTQLREEIAADKERARLKAEAEERERKEAARREEERKDALARAAEAALVAQPARKPWYKRGWVWGVIGGSVVAVGLGVGLGVGLTRTPSPPSAPMGYQTLQPSFP